MKTYYVHPDNPQERIIAEAVQALTNDALIVYPDAHGYQLAMNLNTKTAFEQAVRMGRWQEEPHFELVCQDLSHISQYAQLDNFAHRTMKGRLGRGFDFALPPTKLTPKKLIHDKYKTISVRTANTPITRAILDKLSDAFVSLPIIIDGEIVQFDSAYEVEMAVENLVDGFINAGEIDQKTRTLVQIVDQEIEIIHQGDDEL